MPVYDCYHGTDSKAAESIVRERKFMIQHRKNHWLGNGVYFFIEDVDKAKWWARIAGRRSRFMPTVLYVPIHVDRDQVLNLNAESDLRILNDYAESLKLMVDAYHYMISDDSHEWQCFVLDNFFVDNPSYKIVKRTFESTNQTVGASGLKMLSDQLCVMN